MKPLLLLSLLLLVTGSSWANEDLGTPNLEDGSKALEKYGHLPYKERPLVEWEGKKYYLGTTIEYEK